MADTVYVPSFVSIHAPAWGATKGSYCLSKVIISFNPRSRMGSDNKRIKIKTCIMGFNPRSRMGSDWVQTGHQHLHMGFNPRSRMGSDQLFP